MSLLSRAALAVQEFHAFFDGIIRKDPTRIAGNELALRKNLLYEEFDELIEALNAGDFRAAYKEAGDLLYVLYGLDAHMGGRLDEVFEEVHRANMDKLWECPECEGGDHGQGCDNCKGTGLVAKYREDGKVLKPDDYAKADLSFLPADPPTKDEL